MRSAPRPVRSRTRGARTANRADAGHDLAFGQVAVAHQPSAAFFGARLGVAIKERGNLRLDRPRQQGPGAAAQHLGQRIGKRRWLGKLQNVTCLSMKLSKAAEDATYEPSRFPVAVPYPSPHGCEGCESRMALIAGASFIEFRQRWR